MCFTVRGVTVRKDVLVFMESREIHIGALDHSTNHAELDTVSVLISVVLRRQHLHVQPGSGRRPPPPRAPNRRRSVREPDAKNTFSNSASIQFHSVGFGGSLVQWRTANSGGSGAACRLLSRSSLRQRLWSAIDRPCSSANAAFSDGLVWSGRRLSARQTSPNGR